LKVVLQKDWEIGEQIGAGGFGTVRAATGSEIQAVAKFVPQEPGADRELLFVDMPAVRNVVPILDSGEHEGSWVLVMPRADMNLRELMNREGPALGVDRTREVLIDIIGALADLAPTVVHRDLKPENILLLGGHWCLADFGIARYAEAATATETQKYAMSAPYAAPERWRNEHATAAVDVYAVGVLGYEILAGTRPFLGPGREDLREQHLHDSPPPLDQVDPRLAALVEECLIKAPGARPSAANLLVRLKNPANPPSAGLARLQEANRAQVNRNAETARRASLAATEAERRGALLDAAAQTLEPIADALLATIEDGAPAAKRESNAVSLGNAQLRIFSAQQSPASASGAGKRIPFDVIAHSTVVVAMPQDTYGYEGRSHSLWFCDALVAGEYRWFETAFMPNPLTGNRMNREPFAIDPGDPPAGQALGPGMGTYQVAWPVTRLDDENLEEFFDRWVGWLADAAAGRLHHPGSMPEKSPEGSWRRS
jgi:eukaryotic-like serine/threonine-protein kinase